MTRAPWLTRLWLMTSSARRRLLTLSGPMLWSDEVIYPIQTLFLVFYPGSEHMQISTLALASRTSSPDEHIQQVPLLKN